MLVWVIFFTTSNCIRKSALVGMIPVGLYVNSRGIKFPNFIYPNQLSGFEFAAWRILKLVIVAFFSTHMCNGGKLSIAPKAAVVHLDVAPVISRHASRWRLQFDLHRCLLHFCQPYWGRIHTHGFNDCLVRRVNHFSFQDPGFSTDPVANPCCCSSFKDHFVNVTIPSQRLVNYLLPPNI